MEKYVEGKMAKMGLFVQSFTHIKEKIVYDF
jgi:hypothetical protein